MSLNEMFYAFQYTDSIIDKHTRNPVKRDADTDHRNAGEASQLRLILLDGLKGELGACSQNQCVNDAGTNVVVNPNVLIGAAIGKSDDSALKDDQIDIISPTPIVDTCKE